MSASTALAGCGLFESASPRDTSTESERDMGRTFRAPIGDDPAKTTFLARHGLRPQSLYGWDNASIQLQRFLFETGVWATAIWPNEDAAIQYTWIQEPIEITPTEITIRIRDDARWSDGQRISGTDIATIPLSYAIRANRRPYYATAERDTPENIYHAIDGFDLSDRSVTYRSSAGHFDTFWELHTKKRLGTFFGPHLIPTHLDPYRKYANAVIVTARRAQQGKIDPWQRNPDSPHKRALIDRYIRDIEHAEAYSEPEHVVSSGAWDLAEIRGSQAFVFQPNSHHRNADEINFDSVVLEYTPTATRMNAALQAERFDYASTFRGRVGGYTPESIAESLPDSLTELRIPGGLYTGHELGLNFHHPALEKRNVRTAMMYALDHTGIANNLHPSAAIPIDTPGGDCWDAHAYVDQSWIDDNLQTYTTDRDRAAGLMRRAGYSREGGTWRDSEDQTIRLRIATANETPRWEPTVASQLSEFGIETSVATMDERTFDDRVRRGEFPLWASGLKSLTNKAPATLFVWHMAPENHHQYGIYPDEQFETGRFSEEGIPLPHTAHRFRVFTIQAPPIGEAAGTRKAYRPSALALSLPRTTREEFHRRVEVGIWLANWYLPTIPLAKKTEQHFIDDTHWQWPKATSSWQAFTTDAPRTSSGVLASGTLQAISDESEGDRSS